MTLKRLMLILGILVVLAGVGIMWLWQYAYSPQGRARVIIAQLKGDTTSWRGWMLQHHVVRPGYSALPPDKNYWPDSYLVPEEAMVKLGPKVQPVVIEALRDKEHDVRMMAILSCKKFRDPVAIGPLVQCMRGTTGDYSEGRGHQAYFFPDYHIQYQCVQSLAVIGPEAIPALLETMKDNRIESYVRISAAGWLARKGRDEGFKYLVAASKSGDPFDQEDAASELGTTEIKGTLAPLLAMLHDRNSHVRERALSAIAELHDPRAIPAVRKLLKDPHKIVREDAADVLEYLQAKPPPASQPCTGSA